MMQDPIETKCLKNQIRCKQEYQFALQKALKCGLEKDYEFKERVNIDLNWVSILALQVAHEVKLKMFCFLVGKHKKGEFEKDQWF